MAPHGSFGSRLAAIAVATSLAALTGCSSARQVDGDGGSAGSACTGCHGDAGRAANQAAPPADTHGDPGSPAVGAHLPHLDAGVSCDTCHVVPAALGAAGHIDGGRAEIVFGAAARQRGADPSYDPTARTCANTYCHGGSVTFAPNESPAWNGAALGCAGCHGWPPASHDAGQTDCSSCHGGTVAPDETLLAGGGHLNGSAGGGGHASGFDDPAAHGPAAIAFLSGEAGASQCTTCHGPDYAGGTTGASCNGCHAVPTTRFPSGVGDWRANCTFCHGTPTEPYPAVANPILAAPPESVAGSTAAAARPVGAHRTHLLGRGTGAISDGVACADCHPVPGDLAHVDGARQVVTRRPGTTTTAGSFDAGGGTCSNTYCHGNLPRNGKAGNVPAWTATSGQAACDACHAPQWTLSVPGTTTDSHERHNPAVCAGCHNHTDGRPDCSVCHAGYGYNPSEVNAALHVNGAVDVVTGGLVGWNPSNRSCDAGCHAINAHDVSNPRSW